MHTGRQGHTRTPVWWTERRLGRFALVRRVVWQRGIPPAAQPHERLRDVRRCGGHPLQQTLKVPVQNTTVPLPVSCVGRSESELKVLVGCVATGWREGRSRKGEGSGRAMGSGEGGAPVFWRARQGGGLGRAEEVEVRSQQDDDLGAEAVHPLQHHRAARCEPIQYCHQWECNISRSPAEPQI